MPGVPGPGSCSLQMSHSNAMPTGGLMHLLPRTGRSMSVPIPRACAKGAQGVSPGDAGRVTVSGMHASGPHHFVSFL